MMIGRMLSRLPFQVSGKACGKKTGEHAAGAGDLLLQGASGLAGQKLASAYGVIGVAGDCQCGIVSFRKVLKKGRCECDSGILHAL